MKIQGSKEIQELIINLVNSNTWQENLSLCLIQREKIRTVISDPKKSSFPTREIILQLLHLQLLGVDVDFVNFYIVELSTSKISFFDKVLGYLYARHYLIPTNEYLLLFGMISKDLKSPNPLQAQIALDLLCKLENVEIIPQLLGLVIDLTQHDSFHIRKRAYMTLTRFLSLKSAISLEQVLMNGLKDLNASVVFSAVNLLEKHLEQNLVRSAPMIDLLCTLLDKKQEIANQNFSPWCLIKVISCLGLLGRKFPKFCSKICNAVVEFYDLPTSILNDAIKYEITRVLFQISAKNHNLDAAKMYHQKMILSNNPNVFYCGLRLFSVTLHLNLDFDKISNHILSHIERIPSSLQFVVLHQILHQDNYLMYCQILMDSLQLQCEDGDEAVIAIFKIIDKFSDKKLFKIMTGQIWQHLILVKSFDSLLMNLKHENLFFSIIVKRLETIPHNHLLSISKAITLANKNRLKSKFLFKICSMLTNTIFKDESSYLELNSVLFASITDPQDPIFLDWISSLKSSTDIQVQQQGIEFSDSSQRSANSKLVYNGEMSFLSDYSCKFERNEFKISPPERITYLKKDMLIIRHDCKIKYTKDDDESVLELKNVKNVWKMDPEDEDEESTKEITFSVINLNNRSILKQTLTFEQNQNQVSSLEGSISPENVFLDSNHDKIMEWRHQSSLLPHIDLISNDSIVIQYSICKMETALILKLNMTSNLNNTVSIEYNRPFFLHGSSNIDSKSFFLRQGANCEVFIEIQFGIDDCHIQDLELIIDNQSHFIPIHVHHYFASVFLSMESFQAYFKSYTEELRVIINDGSLKAEKFEFEKFGLTRILDHQGESFGCARLINTTDYLLVNVKDTPFGICISMRSNFAQAMAALYKLIVSSK